MSEAELIAACRRGDREAQRALYKQHVQRTYRLMLRLTGNAEDALDLTQDVFVRALQAIATFNGRSTLGTWLYRIALNQALQLLRRRRTEQRHLRQVAAVADPPGGEAGSHTPDIDGALARLSDEHRAILLLRYQEGLRYDEIAQALDCPPGTVASRLNRARAELRLLLAGALATEGRK